ncbi:MAG: metalloregulator ArsR/SmtB family transcription factor [Candidatus Paceibacterota bacterium]
MYYKIFKLHADLLKALSHPKRLEIIHLLREQKLYVTQIQEMLDLPQANLSQHLQVLREAGVVKTEKEGKQVCYSLADKNFVKACDLVREVLIQRYKNSDFADEFSMKMSDLVPVTHDPVCGMRVSPKTASFAYPNGSHDYYFCASGCLEAFKKNPKKFIS